MLHGQFFFLVFIKSNSVADGVKIEKFQSLPLTPESKEKTVFSTPHGFYNFTVLPLGLCNVPSTFQRLVQHI